MIANCAALGDVTAISGYTTSSKVSASVGGLVGQATGLFHNCYAARQCCTDDGHHAG